MDESFYFMNLDASPMRPPCCSPWLLRYIFMAISPAFWMTDSLLAPDDTLPLEALSSKSCSRVKQGHS